MDSAEKRVRHSAHCSWGDCTRDGDDSNHAAQREGTSKTAQQGKTINLFGAASTSMVHTPMLTIQVLLQFARTYSSTVVMYGCLVACRCCLLLRFGKSATVLTLLHGSISKLPAPGSSILAMSQNIQYIEHMCWRTGKYSETRYWRY